MHRATDGTRLDGKIHLDHSRMRGFSLIETLIVLSLMMIASGIFFMSLQPALKDTRVNNAYNATVMTMRRAREQAIDLSPGFHAVGLLDCNRRNRHSPRSGHTGSGLSFTGPLWP